MIVVDSLRADRLGMYGYPKGTSPNLDRLAEDSLVFEQAYTTAPWTLPSIVTLMTGMHPHALGVRNTDVGIPPSTLTLPEIMRDMGFTTTAIVSHIYLKPEWGATKSFEYVDTRDARGHDHISSPGVTFRAIDFLRRKPNRRHFMLLHYFDPHYPYVDHEKGATPPDATRVTSGMNIGELRQMARAITIPERARLNDIYDSEVRYTDRHIGKFLDTLRAAGRYEDALIIFVADHGEALAERRTRFIGHVASLETSTLRIPLIMKLPGGQPRGRVERAVSTIDIMPTIAREVGAEIPVDANIQGAPFDWSFAQPGRGSIFGETGKWAAHQTVIDRAGRWKLVHDRDTNISALYDLASDPLEHRDVSKDRPLKLQRLESELRSWNAEIEAARQARSLNGEAPLLDAEDEESLRAMGYIE